MKMCAHTFGGVCEGPLRNAKNHQSGGTVAGCFLLFESGAGAGAAGAGAGEAGAGAGGAAASGGGGSSVRAAANRRFSARVTYIGVCFELKTKRNVKISSNKSMSTLVNFSERVLL